MWREVPLGEVATLQRGYDLPERDRMPGTVPVVTSAGISGSHNEARTDSPGVVTGRYGTLGQVYFITEDFWPHNTTLFVKDFHGNDRRFVYYLLGSMSLANRSSVSAVPGVNRNDLHRLKVLLPPLPIQQRIAEILGRLDDKIEANRRINLTLEQMAQALYKHWFVDFGPFQDGEFVESELGLIPKGWGVTRVEEIAELAYGKGLTQRNRIPGPFPVYGSSGVIDSHTDFLVKGPGIVVGRKGTIGSLSWTQDNFWPIDTTYYVVPQREIYSFEYLYFALSSLNLQDRNNDSAVPGLNRNETYNLQLTVPPDSVLEIFNRIVGVWFEKKWVCEQESLRLVAIRDYLLPRLLSGGLAV